MYVVPSEQVLFIKSGATRVGGGAGAGITFAVSLMESHLPGSSSEVMAAENQAATKKGSQSQTAALLSVA